MDCVEEGEMGRYVSIISSVIKVRRGGLWFHCSLALCWIMEVNATSLAS